MRQSPWARMLLQDPDLLRFDDAHQPPGCGKPSSGWKVTGGADCALVSSANDPPFSIGSATRDRGTERRLRPHYLGNYQPAPERNKLERRPPVGFAGSRRAGQPSSYIDRFRPVHPQLPRPRAVEKLLEKSGRIGGP